MPGSLVGSAHTIERPPEAIVGVVVGGRELKHLCELLGRIGVRTRLKPRPTQCLSDRCLLWFQALRLLEGNCCLVRVPRRQQLHPTLIGVVGGVLRTHAP